MGPLRAFVLSLALAGCASSGVLDEDARVVELEAARLAWAEPDENFELTGLYESTLVEGEAAGVLWKVYYHFTPGASPDSRLEAGAYTGAALVFDGLRADFQVLSGEWSRNGARLELSGAGALDVAAAGDHLRLSNPEGAVTLLRVPFE